MSRLAISADIEFQLDAALAAEAARLGMVVKDTVDALGWWQSSSWRGLIRRSRNRSQYAQA